MDLTKGKTNLNKTFFLTIGAIGAIALSTFGCAVSTRNKAINYEEQVNSADSDIHIQEKRRTDLIYNLADCVKAYDKHEYETLINIVEARSKGNSLSDVENLTLQIQAVAEAYPELQSSQNYRELMNELSITENKIAAYRETYNNEIRSYKKYVRQFPNSTFLNLTGYEVKEYDYLTYAEKDTQSISNLFN